MPPGPNGCTRGGVRSGWGERQRGLIDRNDAADVASPGGNLAADRAGQVPKKNVVGRDCNALAKHPEFFAEAARIRE